MDDLTSRQAAIDTIDVLKRNYPSSCFEDLCKAVDIAIKALSAQLEQRWVPCSEKLPEESTDVLVTRRFLGVSAEDYGWNSAPPSTYVEIACLRGDRWVSDSDPYKAAPKKHTDPIAWMPLPEPYYEI